MENSVCSELSFLSREILTYLTKIHELESKETEIHAIGGECMCFRFSLQSTSSGCVFYTVIKNLQQRKSTTQILKLEMNWEECENDCSGRKRFYKKWKILLDEFYGNMRENVEKSHTEME